MEVQQTFKDILKKKSKILLFHILVFGTGHGGDKGSAYLASSTSPQVRSIQYHPGPAWWPNVEPCFANLSERPPSTAAPPPTFGYFFFRSPMLAPPLSL